jgi:hypothetical protein
MARVVPNVKTVLNLSEQIFDWKKIFTPNTLDAESQCNKKIKL